MHRKLLAAIAVSVMIAGCSQTSDDAGHSRILVEQLFAGGLIYDGSGNAPFLADLGISDGKIVFPGDAAGSGVHSEETFDVSGSWVTPGFIDAHSHATLDLDYGRDASPFLYQGIGYEASVQEAIRIGEESGLRVIFSHFNLQGAHNYGRAHVGAKLVNDARERGVEVWAAHHPYTATQSNLRSYTIPDWASAGGREEMIARFDDPDQSAEIKQATNAMLAIRGGADKIMFVDPRPELNGKTLADVSRERELAPADAVQQILREDDAKVMNLELYDHENPLLYTEGVAHVLVNGTFAVRDGKITGALAGIPLKRPLPAVDSQ